MRCKNIQKGYSLHMKNRIPLSVPNFKGNELHYVTQAVEQEWVSSGGTYVSAFEKNMATYAKEKAAVALQSGTAALHLALMECGVQRGDLVIAPALTFIAAINPIRYIGADPIFMDCDDSLCMDMQKLSSYLDTDCERRGDKLYDKQLNRPVTAIVVVHVFGNGADMQALMILAHKYNLPVIEDATEALGSFYTKGVYAGKMCGCIGNFGSYSFNGNKIITTGGGGMLVGQDRQKLDHIRYLSTQAKDDEWYFVHNEVGYNYRMTNLQAALGVAQLEQLNAFIDTKKRNYELYQKEGLSLLAFSNDIRPNYWFYSYLTDHRDRLLQHLRAQGIQARPVWTLNHIQKPYVGCKQYKIDKAPYYWERIINLPCSSNLDSESVKRVAATVLAFEKGQV